MADPTLAEKAALNRILKLDDPARLRTLMSNAKRHGSNRVYSAAFNKLCEILPEMEPGSVKYEVWKSIHALEEMLAEVRGKTVRLSRTRQKIAKVGELKTVADLTLKATPSEGFSLLVNLGHPELLFEAVVLRHPAEFEEDVVAAAQIRMESAEEISSSPENSHSNTGA